MPCTRQTRVRIPVQAPERDFPRNSELAESELSVPQIFENTTDGKWRTIISGLAFWAKDGVRQKLSGCLGLWERPLISGKVPVRLPRTENDARTKLSKEVV